MWDLVPPPGIEPMAQGAWSSNYWTTREVPLPLLYVKFLFLSLFTSLSCTIYPIPLAFVYTHTHTHTYIYIHIFPPCQYHLAFITMLLEDIIITGWVSHPLSLLLFNFPNVLCYFGSFILTHKF